MTSLFLTILNMSITASYVALAVILARFLLRRAPKIFSYILWSAVIIRLVIPVSFTSSFSILRWVQPEYQAQTNTSSIEFVSKDMEILKNPVVDHGVREITRLIHSSLPGTPPIASANLLQIILWIGTIIWIAGAALLLLYSIISYLKIMARIRTATLVKDHIFETDQITTPFVFGFLRPRIYIPTGMHEQELSYILLHEETHIRRRDYLIKPFAFILLIIHWFNPLMWLSYALMCKDMEMSCDERVVSRMGEQIKGSYSKTLLSLSLSRGRFISGSPLAFGESNVKARIRNVLSYRKPSSWMLVSSILLIAVFAVGCTTNPNSKTISLEPSKQPLYSGYNMETLMKNKTLYVGNHIKVGGLIGGMPRPEGLEAKGLELQTTKQPYGVIVHYLMNDSAEVMKEGAPNVEAFYRNAILLLSLIDNVGYITYSMVDHTGRLNGETYNCTFTREQAEQFLGEDVRRYADDEASLRKLIDRLNNQSFNVANSASSL
ncbi:peptidase M56 BlaR1 [Paenibacillus sp. CAA11]|uniref:M56 family metallopeptidase n=1 Tax=Paenibacillus sp. CAA11 TaxID=1532905 RepID=UPI000D3CA771|nr:M56 family metallopeptidase [Paenibacillus sp. CAA11]AWB45248.1 peptidase M56 BlaR1 [Paenibacillus sp. CAA11]